MKYDILLEAHDATISDHLNREKTYQMVSQRFWWPHMYKWVAHYVKTCETCQRVKPSGHASAPLQSLPTIVSDRDPRFTGAFWDTLFQLPGTKLTMSTADHPQTDGRTERVNRVLEDTLRSIVCTQQCGTRVNGVYPVLLEWVMTPPGAANLAGRHRGLHRKWGRARKAFSSQASEIEPASLKRQLSSFIDDRRTLISRIRDAMALAQDKQKEYSDKTSRGNLNVFKEGDLVLLDTKNLPLKAVSSVESNKLKHRFIGPFA
ncbi:Pol protein, partial [Phytophthora palmivora]